MRILRERTTALIIDIQEKLFPHMTEKEQLKKNVLTFAEGLKYLEVPIILTQQYTHGLGPSIPELRLALAGLTPMEKMSFSCCDEPSIVQALQDHDKEFVLLAGIETHVCVLQTAIDLLQAGFTPILITDAVSSRKLSDKKTAIKRMLQEGVLMSSVESVLFELCRTAGTDTFKAISKLVK